MSSTRKSVGGGFRQERFCSSPEFERGLMANLVARRCEVLERAEDRELIWHLQLLSHRDGGLKAIASEIATKYKGRAGTASMRKFGCDAGQVYDMEKVRAVRGELPWNQQCNFLLRGEESIDDLLSCDEFLKDKEIARRALSLEWEDPVTLKKRVESQPTSYRAKDFLRVCLDEFSSASIETQLKELCLNPAVSLSGVWLWWFAELIPVLREMQAQRIQSLSKTGVVTELGKQVRDTLDYTMETRCLSLIDGHARMGKTHSAKAFCELHSGRARYVQVPSSGDDIGFFRAIAKALGVSINLNSKAQELRQRIEETLQPGHLAIVFDEAHFLWPSSTYRDALPGRLLWIMTALVNEGVPVGLITTPQFLRSQKVIERRSNWTSEQFVGRIGHYQKLPDSLSEDDLTRVAQSLLPDGDETSIEILVRYAQGSCKYLAGIESAVRRARFLALKDGRKEVLRADIKRAISESVIPSDSALATALAEPERHSGRRIKAPLMPPSRDLEPARETAGERPEMTLPGNRPGTMNSRATQRQTQSIGSLVSVE